MKYLNILMHCAAEPLLIERQKLSAIVGFLKYQALGGKYSDEEIVAKIGKVQERTVARSEGAVGVLPVMGVIAQRMSMMEQVSGGGGSSIEQMQGQFREMLHDDSIKAIIMHFHSPGGTVHGIEDFGNEIYESRGKKPIIAQVDSVAASAAYWLACRADEIVVTPGGQAGSIGVYSIHEDISEMLAKEGIKETIVSAGKNKVLGNEFEPLSADAREVMQKRVDECYKSFVGAVARGRGTSTQDVLENFGQGLVFGDKELVKLGMADRVGGMADTLNRFGITLNPTVSKARSANALSSQTDATKALITKLSAGDRPTLREMENGLKGLGLSNSEAERAVRVLFKEKTQGEPEEPATDQTAVVDAFAELRERINSFIVPQL